MNLFQEGSKENKMNKKIYVTQPQLPDFDEVISSLKKIWENKWLTNNGEFHQEFERQLSIFLNVPYINLFANGTLALLTALKALKIKGEVITTPYSFVATSHALLWENIKPVFVDIEKETFNLNPQKIRDAITSETTAIMPVHVYGNPCNVEEIEEIANENNLRVIYDAAHCFGVNYKNKSILNYGDLSVLSFHATKVFNTFEGGAIICKDKKTYDHINLLKNFGISNETTIDTVGINAKMNEFQSAIGILNLKKFNENKEKRKAIHELYVKELADLICTKTINYHKDSDPNYSYFPIIIESDDPSTDRDKLYAELVQNEIYSRRYFYPLISNLPSYSHFESAKKSNLPVAQKISNSVLCLPIYDELKNPEVTKICTIIKKFLSRHD